MLLIIEGFFKCFFALLWRFFQLQAKIFTFGGIGQNASGRAKVTAKISRCTLASGQIIAGSIDPTVVRQCRI